MRRGQVTQSADQPQNMANSMPMEIQHDTTSRQNEIVDFRLALASLNTRFENLLGPHPPNDQFTRAYEALPPSPRPTPRAQNVPTCLDYLTVPNDPFADNHHFETSYPVVPEPVAMDPNLTHEDDIGDGNKTKKSKTVKKTKKDAKKAEDIMIAGSSTFSGEPEIQYPEIQCAPGDGSTANPLDLPQLAHREHQFTVRFESPTMPSRFIVEFQKT